MTQLKRQYFGTDGVRGRVGQFPMLPEWVLKLGFAAGRTLAKTVARPKVVIGRDTRLSGPMLEASLVAGFNAAGVDVLLLGDMPTPGVAYLTRTFHAQAGVVISASHNPYYDNGIKFFDSEGRKFCDQVEAEIEAQLDQSFAMVAPNELGSVATIQDASGRYVEFCKASLPSFFDLRGMRLVVDCAHGAAYKIAPNVFRELGAEVVEIGNQPNGLNINKGYGATAPAALQNAVIENDAHVGIALDGDGDRIIMVDHLGQVVDGDEILYILALDSRRKNRLGKGGIVGTLMSNLALEQAMKKEGIPFVRANVGDRYVMSLLHANNWYIGGESSGHIIWLSSTTTGDGIIAALQVLAVMKEQRASLRELLTNYQKCPQVMINLPVAKKVTGVEKKQLEEMAEKITCDLKGSGRALIRPSGTEPLVRVMVEAVDSVSAQVYAEKAAEQVQAFLQ